MKLATLQIDADTFKWRMQDGTLIRPRDMVTFHLFYCVRMVFNATVPREHRIEGKIWQLNPDFPIEYWKAAMQIMMKELAKRQDLSPVFIAQIIQMAEVTEKLATLQR